MDTSGIISLDILAFSDVDSRFSFAVHFLELTLCATLVRIRPTSTFGEKDLPHINVALSVALLLISHSSLRSLEENFFLLCF